MKKMKWISIPLLIAAALGVSVITGVVGCGNSASTSSDASQTALSNFNLNCGSTSCVN